MRKVTIVLEDEKLIAALEKVAEETGHTLESVAMRALQFSKMENEYDFAESERESE